MGLSGINHWEYSCFVKYTEESVDRLGRFLFINADVFSGFREALSVFSGPKSILDDPSISIKNE